MKMGPPDCQRPKGQFIRSVYLHSILFWRSGPGARAKKWLTLKGLCR